jgi:hypothetical protein
MGWLREMAEARDHGKSIKQLLNGGSRKRTKRADPNETVYVLFDLDGTLISVDVDEDRSGLFPDMPEELRVQNKFINSAGEHVVQNAYLRPGVREFLRNMPPHVKVGIWTTSFRNYAEGIAKILFGPSYKSKLVCFLSTDEYKDDKGEKHRIAYDILTDRRFPGKVFNKKVVKDLNLLFNDTVKYGKFMNVKNTVLIDDLAMHKQQNPRNTKRNVITIPIWEPEHYHTDRHLTTLARWLGMVRPSLKIYALPKFTKQKN